MVALVVIVIVLAVSVTILAFVVPGRNRKTKPEPSSEPPALKLVEPTVPMVPRSELDQATQLHVATVTRMEAEHSEAIRLVRSEAENAVKQVSHDLELEFAERRRADRKESNVRSRSALVAKIGEHLAPLLGDFPYELKEIRHVGEMFDYLVYDGLEDGEIKNIVFLEIKTKRSGGRLSNSRERLLRDAIEGGRVKYDIWTPPVDGAKND